jgi:hypothetical protein
MGDMLQVVVGPSVWMESGWYVQMLAGCGCTVVLTSNSSVVRSSSQVPLRRQNYVPARLHARFFRQRTALLMREAASTGNCETATAEKMPGRGGLHGLGRTSRCVYFTSVCVCVCLRHVVVFTGTNI